MATVGIFFFHYPRVCLQSHVGKLHLYLCQWKKFPSGNVSRHQGKPFQFTEIEGSSSRVPSTVSVLSSSSQKKKKRSCFISQRLSHHPPVPAQLRASGHPWHVVLPARYKLCSGHVPCLFTSPLSSANRWNKPLTYGLYTVRRHIASSLSRSAAALFPSLNSTWYPSATGLQAGFNTKGSEYTFEGRRGDNRVWGKHIGVFGSGAGALKQCSFEKRNSGYWYVGWILNATLPVTVIQQPTWWLVCLKWMWPTVGKSS